MTVSLFEGELWTQACPWEECQGEVEAGMGVIFYKPRKVKDASRHQKAGDSMEQIVCHRRQEALGLLASGARRLSISEHEAVWNGAEQPTPPGKASCCWEAGERQEVAVFTIL